MFWRLQQYGFDDQVAPAVQYASQSELKRVYAAVPARTQQYQQAVTSRLQALTPRPHSAAAADPFYGPMLARLDAVFSQLGVHDEGCKERVVCSMYKNPMRYSPHSNLVSAELSRWELDNLLKMYRIFINIGKLSPFTPEDYIFIIVLYRIVKYE